MVLYHSEFPHKKSIEQGDDTINKRLFLAVILCYLLGFLQIIAGAQGIAVGGQNAVATPGDTVRIPVTISPHTGIMGFKISVEFPADVLSNPKVTRGAVTTQGMFADSISPGKNSSFDIVWSGVSDVTEDGVLFILQFDVSDTAKGGTYPIKLAYSQPDTFNEKWEDVVLDVADLNLLIASEEDQTTDETLKQPTEEHPEEDPDTQETQSPIDQGENSETFIDEVKDKVAGDYIQDVIEDALKDVGADRIQDMDDNQFQQFEEITNGAFNDYGVIIENKPADKQSYDQLFNDVVADNFTNDILDIVDEEAVITIIEDTLRANGVNRVDQLPADSVDRFAADLFEALEEQGANCNDYKSPAIDRTQVIGQLCDKVGMTSEQDNRVFNPNIIVSIGILIAGIAVLIVAVYIVINKRRKNTCGK